MSLLVCDDHRMFLDALVDALRAHGHHVAAASADPSRVPDLAEHHRPAVAVLDVQLPGTTGIELAARVRERSPATSVLLLTGSNDALVRHAYDSGVVDGLVDKCTGMPALEAAIRRLIDGERPVVGRVAEALPQPRRRPTPLDLLTEREREVLMLITDGASTAAMADHLGVSVNTVRTHVRSVLQKLGVHHRTKAAHAAVELGLVRSG